MGPKTDHTRYDENSMQTPPSRKTPSRWKRVIAALVILVAAYTIFGFLVLPLVVRSVLTKKLSENLNRETSIQDIDVNPYALSLSVEGLSIKEPDGSGIFVSFDRLYLDLQAVSAFKRSVIFREITLDKPQINLMRHAENRYNFSDLLGEKDSEGKKAGAGAGLPRFSLNNIQIFGGAVRIWDGPMDKEHKVVDINVGIPFVSSLPYHVEIFVQPRFSAKFNQTQVSLDGRSLPFSNSRRTILDIDLKEINIPYYLAYVPMDLDFKMASGLLDIKGAVSYEDDAQGTPALSLAGELALRSVEIVDAEARPLMKFPLLSVSIASVEPLAQRLHLSNVLVQSPEVNVYRDQAGNMNLPALLPKQQNETSSPGRESEGASLSITVDETRLADGKVVFSDLSGKQPFETAVAPINLVVRDFSNGEGTRAAYDFSLSTEAGETLKLSGEFSVNPLAAESALELKDVLFKQYNPYIPDRVKIDLTGGKLFAQGGLSLEARPGSAMTAAYKGDVVVSGLACVDRRDAEDLLKWEKLHFEDMTVGINPARVDIGQVSLEDLFISVVVHPDKKLNLQTVIAEQQERAPSPAGDSPAGTAGEAKSPGVVNIGKVRLTGGEISFLDKGIKPSYSARLTDISASVTGLTSEEVRGADVVFQGKVDKHAPVEIKGKINPFDENLFLDLKMAFQNIDLSPATPYSGRYVGYAVEKGKLSLDLKYLIDNKKLDSQNKFFIDQLEFGRKIDSPEATTLPVKLGVALLKNRKGEIDLDIPVSGSIDDPEFRVGRIIWKAIGNLLVKAATSPFALLGAVVGGGEDLSVVEFDYGRSVLTPEGEEKLDTLIHALYERPALKLDVEGHVDMDGDREGLKQVLFERKLKARKVKEMTKKGAATVSLDDVRIEPDEYEEYLEKAYKKEDFDKPKNFLGFTKSLPVPEMENLILEHIVVQDDDLRLLAVERGKAVQERLLESKMIAPERIFLVEPKKLEPEKKEGMKDSRVELRLK